MSLFRGLARAVVAVVVLPVDMFADVVTLGGVNTNQDRTYTGKRVSDLMDGLNEATRGEDR